MSWKTISTCFSVSYHEFLRTPFSTQIIPPQTPAQTDIGRDKLSAERYLTEQKIPLGSIQILQGGKREMLRSIKKAFDIIKADDPESAVTVHTIRTWCKEGKIKCLTTGNKVLVDIQSLLDYIAMKG